MSSNIKDVHVVIDCEFVKCQICNKELKKIDGRHTKKVHKISFVEYKKQFPNTPTITKDQLEKELVSIKKRKEKKSNIKTKTVLCCNPECNKEFIGNINISNNFSLCSECKSNGLKTQKSIDTYNSQKEGMIKKYGVSNPSNVKEIIQQKQQNLQLKIEKNPEYFKPIVEKRQNTNQQIYGDDWGNVLNEKSQDALEEKYGVRHALQNPDSLQKFQDTCLQETGYKSPFENPDIIKEIKEINLKKYGVENPMQVPSISKIVGDKVKESWKDPEVRQKRNQAYIDNFIPRLLLFLKENANIELREDYQNAHYYHKWKCLKCDYEFKQNWNAIQQGFSCPNCRPKNKGCSSKAQIQISDFIQKLGFDVVLDNRDLIKPYELDIIIHSEKIAIEYCGLFWHTEKILKDTRKKMNDVTKYHLYKLQQCQKQGYKLITIFEDEWIFKQEIVKSRLKQILKATNSKRIHARKCEICELTGSAKNEFLEKFHIQGKDSSSIKLGAFFEDILVSVMTFSKGNISKGSKSKKGVWELNRFCSDSNYHSPGIAGKLLAYFKRNYEWSEIFSYADQRWSDGNLYYQIGFDLSHVTQPNYWYVNINKLKRLHRYGLRKRPDEPKDITERVLRISEGYQVIWDCGNLKFSLKNI